VSTGAAAAPPAGQPPVHPAAVRQDPLVIEGEGPSFRDGDPSGRSSVIGPDGHTPSPADKECHAGRGLTGIAVRPRIDPDQTDRATTKTGLFPQFAHESLLHGLPKFDKAARERPVPPERRSATPHEKDPIPAYPYRVHGQSRVGITRAHGGRRPPPY